MIAVVLTGLVAALHLYFLVLEMFLWNKPFGRKVFRMTPEQSEATASLAANQGLYNGFLAAGLVWSLVVQGSDPALSHEVRLFFLSCVVVAGVFGAATANKKILFVQALPGALALAAALFFPPQ